MARGKISEMENLARDFIILHCSRIKKLEDTRGKSDAMKFVSRFRSPASL